MNNIITPAVPQKLIDFLHFYPMFLIVGHKEPDGDCIGSSIAMSLFLQRLGKKTQMLSAGPFQRSEIRMYEPLFSAHVPESLIKNPEKTAVVDGLTDYIVIDTEEALLICPRSNDQLIKEYVADLESKK